MFKVGVTGNIGSGKTLICQMFASLGVPIFNADNEARRLMNSDPELQKDICRLLGPESFIDGRLNAPYISSIIFQNNRLLQSLNVLVHPRIQKEAASWFSMLPGQIGYAIEEAALLIESGGYLLMDYIIVVTAPQEVRFERLMKRDDTSLEAVLKRNNAQMKESQKIILADSIIVNDGSMLLLPQVLKLHEKLSQLGAISPS